VTPHAFPERPQPATIVVVGLGSLLKSDDAIGVLALRHLEQDPNFPADVSLVEGGTKGLELLPYIAGAARLLVLDGVDVHAAPGTVVRLRGEELRSLPGSGSAHELALADLLLALRMLGTEPPEVVLLGVQPATTELGTSLSTAVQAALPALIDAARAELGRWALSAPTVAEACARSAGSTLRAAEPASVG
jgi:hydrogenase maturation protease